MYVSRSSLKKLFTVAAFIAACPAVVSAADSAYVPVNDMVVIEPERLAYNGSFWQRRTSPGGYLGEGWLYVSVGGRTGDGPCHNVAQEMSCMTDRAGWIEIPVYIENPQGEFGAIFGIDIRSYRPVSGDGGNDIWVGIDSVAAVLPATPSGFAFRIGCSTMGYNYCWGAITPTQLPNQGGWAFWSLRQTGKVYRFFISGRSSTFGVDRIVIYMVRKTNSRPGLVDLAWPDAWNNSIPMTPKVAIGSVGAVSSSAPLTTVKRSTKLRMGTDGVLSVTGIPEGGAVTVFDLRGRALARRSTVDNSTIAINAARGSYFVAADEAAR